METSNNRAQNCRYVTDRQLFRSMMLDFAIGAALSPQPPAVMWGGNNVYWRLGIERFQPPTNRVNKARLP